MSDMTHTEAEELLVSGDEEDVAEALASEEADAERAPEEAAISPEGVDAVPPGERLAGQVPGGRFAEGAYGEVGGLVTGLSGRGLTIGPTVGVRARRPVGDAGR